MPTVNLVSDFGGVGDGQRETVNITVSSGAATLTVGTAIFVVGDVGKTISIWNGANFKTASISGFTSSTVVTLNSNFAFSATASSSDVLWGTDNTNAFTGASGSWRAYARTQTDLEDPPILEIPDGNYLLGVGAGSGGIGGAMCVGVLNNVTIRGQSGTAANCKLMMLQNGELRFGHDPGIRSNRGLYNSGGNSVRLQTAVRWATSVFLSDPTGTDDAAATYGSRVVEGRACLLACYDMQSLNDRDFGYPPNSFFTEWNRISAYNSGTGEVTLETALTQNYSSSHPQWGPDDTSFASGHTSGSDQGGPFTMWIAPDGYQYSITLEDFTIDDPHSQSACHARYVTCNNLIMTGFGLYPTQTDVMEMNDCVYPVQLEVDKMTNQVTWNNCTLNRLQQQSASPNRMILNGGTITTLDTARYTEANNVAITNVLPGVSSYGRTDRVILNNCTGIENFQRTGASTDDLGGTSGSPVAASAFYEFSGGVMRFLLSRNDAGAWNSSTGQQNPTRCLMPGTWILFDDKYIDQVQEVYTDATYCYIRWANTTDWPFTPVSRLKVHPCPDWTVTNCTGTAPGLEDFNQATARAPIYSYSKRSIVAGASAATVNGNHNVTLLGKFVSEKLNVTTAYVGVGSLTFNDSQFLNRTYVKRSDWTTSATFGSTINMKVAGERVIRAATTATGAQASDSLEDMTTPGEVNFTGVAAAGTIFSANVTNGETPTITVEYTMDHGIPAAVPTAVVPLRLRLRA
jgi:hypothetical protein